MKLTNTELQALYHWQPARAELNRTDCLSPELLTRIAVQDVSEAERLTIADHLTTCPDCAQEYKIARATKAWAQNTFATPTEDFPVAPQEQEPNASEKKAQSDEETTPKWWQALLPRFFSHTGFNPFTAAVAGLFLVTSLSLATWLVALHFKHKTELARLAEEKASRPALTSSDGPIDPDILQARIEEAQKQLTEVQTQLVEQNADRVLSNQELLGIQNDTLQKEVEEYTKPQLDAPIIDLDAGKLPPNPDPTKEPEIKIEVPSTAALFTVILHKPADKLYPNYQLDLLDAKKPKPLWSGQKKPTPEPMTLTLTLLRRNYPSGTYRLRLLGIDGKKKDTIQTFNLDVKFLLPPKATKKKK